MENFDYLNLTLASKAPGAEGLWALAGIGLLYFIIRIGIVFAIHYRGNTAKHAIQVTAVAYGLSFAVNSISATVFKLALLAGANTSVVGPAAMIGRIGVGALATCALLYLVGKKLPFMAMSRGKLIATAALVGF